MSYDLYLLSHFCLLVYKTNKWSVWKPQVIFQTAITWWESNVKPPPLLDSKIGAHWADRWTTIQLWDPRVERERTEGHGKGRFSSPFHLRLIILRPQGSRPLGMAKCCNRSDMPLGNSYLLQWILQLQAGLFQQESEIMFGGGLYVPNSFVKIT